MTFEDMGLRASLRATLDQLHFEAPTEVQARAIPALLGGRSVVAVAETGSGKTLAYALPLMHQLKALEDEGDAVSEPGAPRAVVLVPTRELGEQVARVFKTFNHDTRLRVRTALGGTKMVVSRESVKGAFEIIVATPGRLVQLLTRGELRLDAVRTVVLDEVDQLVDQGFMPDTRTVVAATPPRRQLALFTATLPGPVEALAGQLVEQPAWIRGHNSHHVVASLTTVHREVVDGRRFEVLQDVLREPSAGGTLLFTNTRAQCDKLAALLRADGKTCVVLRGEMDRVERRDNLRAFRAGTVELLVTTDLGARGLDIDHVGRVVNYHLPEEVGNYLHRVGRTARAGRPGTVVNLVTARDKPLLERLVRTEAR